MSMKTVSPEGTARRSSSSSPPLPQPFFSAKSPPPSPAASGVEADGRVSPGLLLAIVILAVVFFVSGLFHLLVRVLMARHPSDPDESDGVTALQGQLQQLFHLHDSGVDQSFIDALPVFHYRAIIGLNHPFDCAVCLCEFGGEDRLRLLPKCSHAFHMECIDTWLLSHSTCPLCRSSLLPNFPSQNGCSPVVLVLESGRESSREMLADAEANTLSPRARSLLGLQRDEGLGTSRIEVSHRSAEVLDRPEESPPPGMGDSVVPVKLGKFRNVNGGGGEARDGESDGMDARRCFSMGSFRYVMDENSPLRVPIRTSVRRQVTKNPPLPLVPGLRSAMSECDCESKREFDGFEAIKTGGDEISVGSRRIGSVGGKRESFSVSKIWLRGNSHENPAFDTSRRAFSLRFPMHRGAAAASAVSAAADGKLKVGGGRDDGRRTVSEIDFRRWENGGGGDEENQSHNSLDSQANAPSFARRTLLWLLGRQSKVIQSPLSPRG